MTSALALRSFDFFEGDPSEMTRDAFVVQVPIGISEKAELMASLARLGHFPTYFGANWDALSDCLRDFDWVGERLVAIRHDDLPLSLSPSECRTYLEVLGEAVDDWKRLPQGAGGQHELRVLFPAETRRTLQEILSS